MSRSREEREIRRLEQWRRRRRMAEILLGSGCCSVTELCGKCWVEVQQLMTAMQTYRVEKD